MNLKKLTISFQNIDDLFKEINHALKAKKKSINPKKSITFDSIESYRSFMSTSKANILSAISKFKPNSVYELASYLKRKPQHVLVDCRSLESHGFIKLIQEEEGRRSLKPELIFEYDIIVTQDKISMPLAISSKAESLLLKAAI